jgi:predicted dehydrogenase
MSMLVSVLGDFNQVQSVFKTQDKFTPLFDDKGAISNPKYKVTAPDHLLVQGVLQDGGIASMALRFSSTAVNDGGYRWIITGSKGEIELVMDKSGWFHQGLPLENTTIYVHKRGGEGEPKTEEVKAITRDDEPEYLKGLPAHVVNTARLYQSFATGDEKGYADVDATLVVQRLMARINKEAICAEGP